MTNQPRRAGVRPRRPLPVGWALWRRRRDDRGEASRSRRPRSCSVSVPAIRPGSRSWRRAASGLIVWVEELLGDRLDTAQRDAGPLLDGERMGGWFQFHEGPDTDRLAMNPGFEVQRGGLVARQLGREPAEVGGLLNSLPAGPELLGTREVRLAERDPHAPGEVVSRVSNGQDQSGTDEVVLGADHAAFVVEEVARLAVEAFMPVDGGRRLVCERQSVVLLSAAGAEKALITRHGRKNTRRSAAVRGCVGLIG